MSKKWENITLYKLVQYGNHLLWYSASNFIIYGKYYPCGSFVDQYIIVFVFEYYCNMWSRICLLSRSTWYHTQFYTGLMLLILSFSLWCCSSFNLSRFRPLPGHFLFDLCVWKSPSYPSPFSFVNVCIIVPFKNYSFKYFFGNLFSNDANKWNCMYWVYSIHSNYAKNDSNRTHVYIKEEHNKKERKLLVMAKTSIC